MPLREARVSAEERLDTEIGVEVAGATAVVVVAAAEVLLSPRRPSPSPRTRSRASLLHGLELPIINFVDISPSSPYKGVIVLRIQAKKVPRTNKGKTTSILGLQYFFLDTSPVLPRPFTKLWTRLDFFLREITTNYLATNQHLLSAQAAKAISLGNY
jgi:hypothetical protein